MNTIGTVRVSTRRARTAGVLLARMTSGLRLTSSRAAAAVASTSPLPTDVDPQVLALAPAEPLHLIAKGGELDQPLGIVGRRQHAKPSKPPRLLRGCATVEGRRGRKTQNDLSSPHPSTRIYERLRVR